MIVLEGMGLMGSLIAPCLEDLGIEFRWYDTDEQRVQSWRASTGGIFPHGNEESMTGLRMWRDLLSRDTLSPTFRQLYREHTQRARYCYYSKNPPHGGAAFGVEEVAKIGGVRFSNMRSYHIDAQQVVETARSHYRKQRIAGKPKRSEADLLVVTHGWRPKVIGAYSWGWSGIVTAKLSKQVRAQLRDHGDATGCFYLRNGYQVCYLYPVGRTGAFYAGTTLVTQKSGPKDADPRPHYERWARQLEEFSEGHLAVRELLPDTLRQAWRPKHREDQEQLVWRKGHTVFLKPAYGNGIRLFPLYFAELLTALNSAGVVR